MTVQTMPRRSTVRSRPLPTRSANPPGQADPRLGPPQRTAVGVTGPTSAQQDTGPHRAAVSALSAALVLGPTRTATVVGSAQAGCYLHLAGTGRHRPEVLPVLVPEALALPTAVRLAYPCAELAALAVRDRVQVGHGRIEAAGLTITIVRTFRPSRVRESTDGSGPDTAPETGPEPSLDGSGSPGPDTGLVERIGLGLGLTPEIDDELAGHLLVAVAMGWPTPDLEPYLHQTSALSASLLRAAAQGYAVPAVVAYVDAVVGHDQRTADRVRPQIEAIGHTSGPALLRGIHAATARIDAEADAQRSVA